MACLDKLLRVGV